jgi:carbonic anhydrase/acetyltransferase-like protein (isoleucine patch superfamily)
MNSYPENKLFPYEGKYPELHENVYLSSGVKIIGDVKIGKDSSVWYNSVIRGDVNFIKIGKVTNIQDLSMLHVTNGKYPLEIGDRVTIGHSVKLHGCTVHDECLIGIGAVVLDGAVINSKSIIAAGSVITPGFNVPSGKLAAGVPAKIIRNLTGEELNDIAESAVRYRNYTLITVESLKQVIS